MTEAVTGEAEGSVLPGRGTITVVLVRHGATEWSVSGRHTGVTDLALTPNGEKGAVKAGETIRRLGLEPEVVWVSPRQRAKRTCELAGFGRPASAEAGSTVEVVEDVAEWDYGRYEGLTTPQIRESDPGWTIWEGGGPAGESPEDVSARADRVVARLLDRGGTVAVFSHGHFLRSLAVRWVGLDIGWGRALSLDAGAVSVLGFDRDTPVIALWNEQGAAPGRLEAPLSS